MKAFSRLTVSLVIVWLLVVIQHVPVVQAANGGRVFALGFFNLTNGGNKIFEEISISCFKCRTTVRVWIPSLNDVQDYQLDGSQSDGWYRKVTINKDIATATNFPVGLKWPNFAILVLSLNASISVQVNKAGTGTGAGYLAFPVTWSSTYITAPQEQQYQYYIASYAGYNGNSVVTVMSLFNDTCVEIDKYDEGGLTFTRLQTFTLQANEVFNMYASTMDFTGVLVETRKPVAVFGGADSTQIPANVGSTDAIMEQMPKTALLRLRYIMLSIPGRPYDVGFKYRVIGASGAPENPNVTIYEVTYDSAMSTPTLVFYQNLTLDRGAFFERSAGVGSTGLTVVIVDCGTLSSGVCMVAQYNVGNQEPAVSPGSPGGGPLYYDPSMVIIPPPAAFTRDITFSTSSVNYGNGATAAANFLTIYVNGQARDNLQLDNIPISTYWLSSNSTSWTANKWVALYVPSNASDGLKIVASTWYVTTIGPINDGFHYLTTYPNNASGDLYMAIVFGFGNQASQPIAYSYLAGYNMADTDIDPDIASLYDITQSAAANINAATTTAAGSGTPTSTPGVAANAMAEPTPSYGMIFLANFTVIDWSASGKIPDRKCSITYGYYFIDRVNNLATAVMNPAQNLQFLQLNPSCAVSGINVTVSVGNLSSSVYFSEYSRSAGFFYVNVTGSGSATLGNIFSCATQASLWFRDPNNWIPDYNGDTTKFLDIENVYFDMHSDLNGCSKLSFSNPDGFLTIYSRNWVCPLATTSVFGSANSRYQTTTSVPVFMVSVFVFTMLLR